jgi:hypothetical protein
MRARGPGFVYNFPILPAHGTFRQLNTVYVLKKKTKTSG